MVCRELRKHLLGLCLRELYLASSVAKSKLSLMDLRSLEQILHEQTGTAPYPGHLSTQSPPPQRCTSQDANAASAICPTLGFHSDILQLSYLFPPIQVVETCHRAKMKTRVILMRGSRTQRSVGHHSNSS